DANAFVSRYRRFGTCDPPPFRCSWKVRDPGSSVVRIPHVLGGEPMTSVPIRDVSLGVEVIGQGYPLLLMHGGPGADHWMMLPFRRLADGLTLVFYDHRCNGRST